MCKTIFGKCICIIFCNFQKNSNNLLEMDKKVVYYCLRLEPKNTQTLNLLGLVRKVKYKRYYGGQEIDN